VNSEGVNHEREENRDGMMAGCGVVVLSAAVPMRAAQMPKPQAATETMKASDMQAKCQAMMAEHDKLMADMRVADQRIDGLVVKMNTAPDMEKMAATATVVTAMVTESRTMRDRMMKRQQDMMAHMMEHMQAGMATMAMCPMMTPAGDTKH
jgi:hypothetical protein